MSKMLNIIVPKYVDDVNYILNTFDKLKNCLDTTIQQSLESAGINTNQSNLIKEIFWENRVPEKRNYSFR